MTLEEINNVLSEYEPDNFILQSFSQETRELSIAFTCDGGPREDQAFLVTFNEAVVFHIPSVICHRLNDGGPFVLLTAPIPDVSRIIPDVNFDEEEFGEDGFKIFLLTRDGKATGYYIAAESVTASWVPRSDCIKVW